MAEYSRKAQGSFTISTPTYPVYLPFVPDFVQVWNLYDWVIPNENGILWAMWNKFMNPGQLYAKTWDIPPGGYQYVTQPTNGITPIIEGRSLDYEAPLQIQSITTASSAVVTLTAPHNFLQGDTVIMHELYEDPTHGMQQIAGLPFTVDLTTLGSAQFRIKWNTAQSNYNLLTGSPVGAVIRRVKNPDLFNPKVLYISSMSFGYTTTIGLTTHHNLFVGQEVSFRIPEEWGAFQFNSARSKGIPGAPLNAIVVSVVDTQTVVVNINSSSYTPFNSNIPFAQFPGLSFPQLIPVGDTSMGGAPISINSPLYPSTNIQSAFDQPIISGPGIQGAFVNNSKNGFIIGSAILTASPGSQVCWMACCHDMEVGSPPFTI